MVRPRPAPPLQRRQFRKPQAITPQKSINFTVSHRPYGVVQRFATEPTYVRPAMKPAVTTIAAPGNASGERWRSNSSRTSEG